MLIDIIDRPLTELIVDSLDVPSPHVDLILFHLRLVCTTTLKVATPIKFARLLAKTRDPNGEIYMGNDARKYSSALRTSLRAMFIIGRLQHGGQHVSAWVFECDNRLGCNSLTALATKIGLKVALLIHEGQRYFTSNQDRLINRVDLLCHDQEVNRPEDPEQLEQNEEHSREHDPDMPQSDLIPSAVFQPECHDQEVNRLGEELDWWYCGLVASAKQLE